MKKIFGLILIFILFLAAANLGARDNFPPATAESQGLSPEALQKLKARVQDFLDAEEIVGAEFVVIKNRHTVLHEVFGWKDREDGAAIEKDTLFNLRSMTKTLTGAAAQILIDEGKLKLTDRAAQFLPGFMNPESETITIKQLLSHRSGLPLTILTTVEEMEKHDSLQSVANATGEKGPKFDPDEKFWYSDAGSEVLGAVIEVVTEKSLDDFVTERILTPLKMTRSRYIFGKDPVNDPSVASLYGGGKGNWKRFWSPSNPPFYKFPMGSQSVSGTAQDYARFLAMLMDGGKAGETRLLSEEAVARILTPVSRMSTLGSDTPMPTGFPGHKVYYGQMAVLHLDEKGADPKTPSVIGHTGSDGTYAWAWPKKDLIVLFFTQSRGSASGLSLETVIHNLLIDPDAAEEEAVLPEEFQPCLGDYSPQGASPEDKPFTVLFQNGNLAVDVPGRMVFELNGPDDQNRWTFKLSRDISVSFSRDDGGGVEGMKIAQILRIQQDKNTAAVSYTHLTLPTN